MFLFQSTRERLRRQASDWLAKLQSDDAHRYEDRFRQWYEADRRHAEAFDRVSHGFQVARLLRQSSTASERNKPQELGQNYAWSGIRLAAGIAALAFVPTVLVLSHSGWLWSTQPNYALLLTTKVGEIREVRLQDGSRVTIDSASEVKVTFDGSQRRANVTRGRARFAVARDRRPFMVSASGLKLEANGGVFDFETQVSGTKVEMLEGTAIADSIPSRPLSLHEGQGELTRSGSAPKTYRLPISHPEWPLGVLQFRATPLSEAAAEANRYTREQLIVDPDVGQLTVSGAFRAGDLEGFARTLSSAFDLRLTRVANGNWRLSRRP